jgi:hypothetical protein
MRRLFGIAATAFVLNVAWEYLHLPLYTGYGSLGGPLPVWLYASLGDVLYTLLAIGAVCACRRGTAWLWRPGRGDYAALSFVGLCVAVFVEYKAMLLHRWAYTALMPVVFGFGVDPLLQMAIVVPLSVWLVHTAAARA